MWKKTAWFTFLLFVAACWLVFDDLFAPLAPQAQTVEIPSLCGMQAEAVTAPPWASLEIEYRHDAKAPKGEIIAQKPTGGSRRKWNSNGDEPITVHLVVSLGEETLVLPSLEGSDARVAASQLREMGCTVETVYRTGAYPVGQILAMEPHGGTEVPIGTHVVLTVSEGIPTKSVTVPDLRGLSRADALVQLWLAQLSLERVEEVYSDAPVGTVIAQDRLAGTTVPTGTKLILTVSLGLEDE